jgi:glycosyltransferase involved in cell wall biosynthesis
MKVLHVMNGASGGAARSTIEFASCLAQRGVESSAVCIPAGLAADRVCLETAFEGRVEYVPLYPWSHKRRVVPWKRPLVEAYGLGRSGFLAGSTGRVAAAARRFGSELVHTNTSLVLEGALAAKLLGLPHVWHVRERIGPDEPFWFPWGHRTVRWALDGLSSQVVANGDNTADRLAPHLGYRPTVVRNGIPLEPLLALGSPFQRPPWRVAMVAHLSSRVKKHATFLRAMALLPSSLPARFAIFGNGRASDPYVAELRRLAHGLGLEERLDWLDGMTDAAEIMEKIDLLVHPTPDESFGRVVVEAMAAGRPVVGANGGGVAELVDDPSTGWLAGPTPSAIASACLQALLDTEDATGRGQRGRERATAEHSVERVAREIEGIYTRTGRRAPT